MVPAVRSIYNSAFSLEKYKQYLHELEKPFPGQIEFRVAETPVFCSKAFTDKMLGACESIVDLIVSDNFKERSHKALPKNVQIEGEGSHTQFIAFDFGVCENEQGELEPQLIEMQGFPTLFAFQVWQDEVCRKVFNIPANYSPYLSGFDKNSYLALLKQIIVGDHAPENVVLLEISPATQKTRIDFYFTQHYTGIQVVDLMELIREDDKLFYLNNNKKIQIRRIYNRIIFDELQQQSPEVQAQGKLLNGPLEVEWVPHPNWFFRISKHTLPFINHPFVPETYFLSEMEQLPADLENYVLKPLFSFAGQGVVIDVCQQDVDNIKDPENWILQRKVKYADVIETPGEKAKAEIRIFYFWKNGAPRPVATNNLARISKGKMIGVRYNKDKEWVGGTLAYFEQE